MDNSREIVPHRKRRPGYWVFTFDFDKRCWSPQIGVKAGPYKLFGLKKPIRELRSMGYGFGRADILSVLIVHIREEAQ